MTRLTDTPWPKDAAALQELFTAICDEGATVGQFRALEEMLRQDPQATDHFVQLMQLHVLLEEKFTTALPHKEYSSRLPRVSTSLPLLRSQRPPSSRSSATRSTALSAISPRAGRWRI